MQIHVHVVDKLNNTQYKNKFWRKKNDVILKKKSVLCTTPVALITRVTN